MFFVCNLRPSSQAECRRFDDVQIPKSVVGLDLYQLFGCLQYLVEPSEGRAYARSRKAIAFPQLLSGACFTTKRTSFPRNQPEPTFFALFQKGFKNPPRKPNQINGRIYPIRPFQKVRVEKQVGGVIRPASSTSWCASLAANSPPACDLWPVNRLTIPSVSGKVCFRCRSCAIFAKMTLCCGIGVAACHSQHQHTVDSIYPEAVENPPWLLIGSGFQHSPVCASVTLELLCLKIRNLAEE
jgi:hypothetical protein